MTAGTLTSRPAAESYPAGSPRSFAIPLGLLRLAALASVFGAGALLRLPRLQTLPKLTDEMRDAIFSLPISRGDALPLANFSSYDGALFNYLQAVMFWLVGPDLEAPRVLMLWSGLLTLPLVYVCVRRAHGFLAGLLAAAMLAVSPVHVLVNSRVAWGNSLTPLLTTPAFWLVYRYLRAEPARSGQRDPAWNLVPAGLLFGLALQTHPTVLGFLPGVALALLLGRPARLVRNRWTWLGLLGFMLGYANMIAFNLLQNFESVAFAQQTKAEYTGAAPDFGREYLRHLSGLLLGLFRMLGGAVEDRDRLRAFLLDPALLGVGLVVAAGVLWSLRRGDRLTVLVTLSCVFLLPVVNDRYEPILDGRYVAPLLPLLYGATSRLLVDLWQARRLPRVPRLAARVLCLFGLAGLLLLPLVGLSRYHQQNTAAAQRSARLWGALALAERNVPPGGVAIIDRDLERVVHGAGSTELLAFQYAFTLHNVPHRVLRVTTGSLSQAMVNETSRLVVMERTKRKLLDPRLKVRQLDGEAMEAGIQPYTYGIYLISWDHGRRT